MRIAAEQVHRVRKGEITCTVRKRTRRHSAYRIGAKRCIQKVEHVRRVDYDQIHAPTGEPCVYYEPKIETLRERVEVLGVRPSVLDELRPDEIAASGFPADSDDWLDYFRAELACGSHALVWVIRFAMAGDEPRFMANQQGTTDPPQYVSSQARAMDDMEAIDDETLNRYVAQNRQATGLREQHRRELHDLKAEHARLAALEPFVQDLGLERQMARVRQAIRALEKEARKRAA